MAYPLMDSRRRIAAATTIAGACRFRSEGAPDCREQEQQAALAPIAHRMALPRRGLARVRVEQRGHRHRTGSA